MGRKVWDLYRNHGVEMELRSEVEAGLRSSRFGRPGRWLVAIGKWIFSLNLNDKHSFWGRIDLNNVGLFLLGLLGWC